MTHTPGPWIYEPHLTGPHGLEGALEELSVTALRVKRDRDALLKALIDLVRELSLEWKGDIPFDEMDTVERAYAAIRQASA